MVSHCGLRRPLLERVFTPLPFLHLTEPIRMSPPPTGKWVDVASADVPAVEVAHDALQTRLAFVESMLPLAARHNGDDVEHVHRLRVGCRRAVAALSAFDPLVPGKSKPLRRWLKRLRRAAGPARDADVMLERFRDEQLDLGFPRELLIKPLEKQRKRAQHGLEEIEEEAQSGDLRRAIDKCLDAIEGSRKSNRVAFGEFARKVMAAVVSEMFDVAEIPEPTIPELHELRIAGKQVRYSIELFHTAFPKSLRGEVYPKLVDMQDRLGELNDRASAQQLMQKILAKMPPEAQAVEIARCIVRQYEEAEALRERFLEWRTPERMASLRSELDTLL